MNLKCDFQSIFFSSEKTDDGLEQLHKARCYTVEICVLLLVE